jgi:uracil-DNA glycosylase family 4
MVSSMHSVTPMPSSSATLFARYLAYQRDIGTDEVILPEPWVAPAPVPKVNALSSVNAASPAATSASAAPVAKATRDFAGQMSPPPEDTQAYLRSIADSLRGNKAGNPSGTPIAPTPAMEKTESPSRLGQADAPLGLGTRRLENGLEEKTFPTLAAWQEAFAAEATALHPAGAGLKLGPWVYGTGAQQATLAVVTLQPNAEAEAELLGKMLKALKIETGDLYFTSLMKVAHPGRGWARKDTVKLLPWLAGELRLVRPQVILVLGEDAAQLLLRVGAAYEALRQKSHTFAGFEVAMTLGLGRLLAQEELKRDAWKDLQWLMQRLKEKGAIA